MMKRMKYKEKNLHYIEEHSRIVLWNEFDKSKIMACRKGVCPFCGSESIYADPDDVDFGSDVSMKVSCNICGKKWIERYLLYECEELE